MYKNPYSGLTESGGKWWKSNFHLHAGTETDAHDIDDVFSSYKQAGYDIIMVSNQHVFTDTSAQGKRQGISAINGFEYMEQEELLCIGIRSFLRGSVESVIDQVREQGGFVIACHPNYLRRGWWPPLKMASLSGIIGVEIMNPIIFRIEGSGLATDVWDQVLSKGRLIWGFANDDFHSWRDFARAWTMIHAPSPAFDDIKTAVLHGHLYASTGLVLAEHTLERGTVKVALDCGKIDHGEIVLSFIGEGGRILKTVESDRGMYRLLGDEKYARVRANAESGAQLWTQPVYDEDFFGQ